MSDRDRCVLPLALVESLSSYTKSQSALGQTVINTTATAARARPAR